MVDTIGHISYWLFTIKTEIMLTDPTFQELLMALATFVIGWFLKRPQDIIKKNRD
jgi:hypothetical protein